MAKTPSPDKMPPDKMPPGMPTGMMAAKDHPVHKMAAAKAAKAQTAARGK